MFSSQAAINTVAKQGGKDVRSGTERRRKPVSALFSLALHTRAYFNAAAKEQCACSQAEKAAASFLLFICWLGIHAKSVFVCQSGS